MRSPALKLSKDFYTQDALKVAPDLLGKNIVRKFDDGKTVKKIVTEVEVYRGEEDLASHARFGRTARNDVMYQEGGLVYVYLIYGIYWLINVVTGPKDHPQAVLIRGLEGVSGPGKVGQFLQLDKSFYGLDLVANDQLWFEENPTIKTTSPNYSTKPRVGINYAGEWKDKPWRFVLN